MNELRKLIEILDANYAHLPEDAKDALIQYKKAVDAETISERSFRRHIAHLQFSDWE
jgi:ferritin-like protein|tara:strand:- start:315 stop:485 length:171 start_codon:yes stop_codon:yes gene_type:complete